MLQKIANKVVDVFLRPGYILSNPGCVELIGRLRDAMPKQLRRKVSKSESKDGVRKCYLSDLSGGN